MASNLHYFVSCDMVSPTMTQGEKGEKGDTGERGPARRFGPLYGYMVASAIFIVIVYVLQFQDRRNSIQHCEHTNDVIREVNGRQTPLYQMRDSLIIHVGQDAKLSTDPQYKAGAQIGLKHLKQIQFANITPNNCPTQYTKPWPFNWL